jgi:AraC family cel operon transcriptional repressor
MRTLSHHGWPKGHACTYVAWDYHHERPGDVHDQDYYELFWTESGRGCHWVHGQRRLMEAGYLALVRPEDAHGFSAWQKGETVRFINFAFRPALWEKVRAFFFPGKARFFDKKALRDREFHIGPDDRERLRLMAADLAAGRWNQVNASAFLHGTLALLANRETSGAGTALLPEWLARAVRAVETWPHFAGGVPEFVRLAGRSHEHVSRDCRRLLDLSPRDLVNRARLKWAAMQLETTEKKIVDIAAECGFDNLGHFYKLFRSTYRLTPRAYRLRFGIRERE